MTVARVLILCLIGSTSCTESLIIDYSDWERQALSSLQTECEIFNTSCSTEENEYDVWREEIAKLKMTKVFAAADSLALCTESLDSISIISSLYYGYDLENVGSSTILVHSKNNVGYKIDGDSNLLKLDNPLSWISGLGHFKSGCNYSLDFVTTIKKNNSKGLIDVKTFLGREI